MFQGCLGQLRGSRRLVLLIVAIALLLDNMLLTSVVPIIPSFLYHLRHRPVGTLTIPEENISHDAVPTVSLNDENIPYFLSFFQKTAKFEAEDLSGFTIVPDDVFWKFTSSSASPQEVTEVPASPKKLTKHQELVNENFEVSLMFASKPLVQAFANPFIGPISNRVGYSVVMFMGFLILIATSLSFAIGNTYTTLFMARALQGVGSSCTSVAGMGMLAEIYPDDAERGNAMAIALGGLALGVLIGPVFGGTLYQFVGKATPFLILAGLALLDGALQLLVLQPKVKKKTEEEGPSLWTLMKDPYIMIAAGAITFSNIGIAVLEPSLPLWMMDKMDASKWQQGVAFLPASISYLIGTNLFGPIGHRMGRWLAAMIGLIIIGVCLICVPLARTIEELIPANAGIGLAIGMVDSSMMPMLGYLVDIRHTSVYGCVYAIADVAFCLGFIIDVAFCLGFTIGPVFSATIVQRLGFEGTVCAVAMTSFLFAPFLVFLRKPPGKASLQLTSGKDSTKYVLQSDDENEEESPLKNVMDQPVCY